MQTLLEMKLIYMYMYIHTIGFSLKALEIDPSLLLNIFALLKINKRNGNGSLCDIHSIITCIDMIHIAVFVIVAVIDMMTVAAIVLVIVDYRG